MRSKIDVTKRGWKNFEFGREENEACEEIPRITVFAGPSPAEKVSGAGVIGVPSTLIPATFPRLTPPPRFCYTYRSLGTPALAILFFLRQM
jgi:hypothetical protein